MLLKLYRKQKGMTQEMLAKQTGINYRSLQDYEQGHKKLSSANGDTLLRRSTVLGCSIEELLVEEVQAKQPHGKLGVPAEMVQNQIIPCPKYNLHGRWVCANNHVFILFYYRGSQHIIPFDAVFTEKALPWLKQSAALVMESKVEEINFMQSDVGKGGLWDG